MISDFLFRRKFMLRVESRKKKREREKKKNFHVLRMCSRGTQRRNFTQSLGAGFARPKNVKTTGRGGALSSTSKTLRGLIDFCANTFGVVSKRVIETLWTKNASTVAPCGSATAR